MGINFTLSDEEYQTALNWFNDHLQQCGGNDLRYKDPHHWLKFVFYEPPRDCNVYKKAECNCGDYFLISKIRK